MEHLLKPVYVKLTNRCNMSCAHCCFSCGITGMDMAETTVNNVVSIIKGRKVTLGGGEPTLVKHLISTIIKFSDVSCAVELTSNGKETEVVLELIKLKNKLKNFKLLISIDRFHDAVSKYVIDWAIENNAANSVKNVIPIGRAALAASVSTNECCCAAQLIDVDGTVYQCGCPDSRSLGNVNEGYNKTGIYGCGSVSRRRYARNF